MCMQNKLERMLLLILISILTSCSGGDKASSPSLNADDIWDQMAEERQKPLPVNSPGDDQGDDSDEMLSDPPFATSSGPLSIRDIDAYLTTLRVAGKKYQAIMTTLDAGFVALPQETTEEDRQARWRTMQLHLSRLTNLRNNMDRATNALGVGLDDVDQVLVDKNRNLLAVMAKDIARIRSRLDEFASLNE